LEKHIGLGPLINFRTQSSAVFITPYTIFVDLRTHIPIDTVIVVTIAICVPEVTDLFVLLPEVLLKSRLFVRKRENMSDTTFAERM